MMMLAAYFISLHASELQQTEQRIWDFKLLLVNGII